MSRKVIQIAIVPETEWTLATTTALCDDGTIWRSDGNGWEIVEPVPGTYQAEFAGLRKAAAEELERLTLENYGGR